MTTTVSLLPSTQRSEALRKLETELAQFEREKLTPATEKECRAIVGALVVHYPPDGRTAKDWEIAGADWLREMARFPLDVLEDGRREWLRSPQHRMPSLGEMLALWRPVQEARLADARLMREQIEAWRKPIREVPTEDDKEAISKAVAELGAHAKAKGRLAFRP